MSLRSQSRAHLVAKRFSVLGVDPSLTSTGFAYETEAGLKTGRITPEHLRGPKRLFYVRLMLSKVIDQVAPTLVVMEGYAMGARGNNMFDIGELGGVLKTMIWERGIDSMLVPPTVMKSVIALNGRAEKQQISAALRVRFGITVRQHDEADAVGLMILGQMRTGARRVDPNSAKSGRFEAVSGLPITPGKLNLISNPR